MEQCDAVELRRRRRFLVGGSLLSGLLAAGGILIVLGGQRLGYIITAFFGVCAITWAGRLLTPPEVLLELPASDFRFAPREARIQHRLSEVQSTGKPTRPMPEPTPVSSGVWDPDLDFTP